MMARRALGHAPALLVSLMLAAPLSAQPTAHPGSDGVAGVETMTPAAIAARGAAAQIACAERPHALCLAEIALARAAAGQGPSSLAPTEVTAAVVAALAKGGHGPTLRTLLPLVEAVNATQDPAAGGGDVLSALPFLRAGLPDVARRVLMQQTEADERSHQAVRLAVETLDRLDLAAAEAAADHLDPGDRAPMRAWIRAFIRISEGDRAGVDAVLQALDAELDFDESWNGDPTGPERSGAVSSIILRDFYDGADFVYRGDTRRTRFVGDAGGMTALGNNGQQYSGIRNLPRLAAHGYAAFGDADRALAAADAVRYPVGRISAYEAIARRLPAQRPAVDARIIAVAETMPDDPTLRSARLAALIRSGRLHEADQALARMAEDGVAAWEPDVSAPWRQLAAAYQRLGPSHAWRSDRVAESAARASRRFHQRYGPSRLSLQQSIDATAAQVRLSAALAARDRPQDVAELLRRYAPGHEIERCVAQRDGDCLALILTLQAIEESPSD